MGNEQNIQKLIMVAASKAGARVFRNNTGVGWVGKVRRLSDNTIHITHPRPLEAGLCVGSSDLIGWKPTTITPDMVGKTIGVFVALEIKAGTKPSPEQLTFIENVRRGGGIAGIARSPEEATDLLTQLHLF